MALLNVVMLAAIFSLVMISGVSFTQLSQKVTRVTKYDQQAYNVARAGLVDAINWFKRRPVQPVEQFDPVYNEVAPAKGDTNDPGKINPGQDKGKPHLGIVQEFQLDERSNLWGRYEIGKLTRLGKDSNGQLRTYSVLEKNAAGSWVENPLPDAISDEWEGVQDVTNNQGLSGKGLIWKIRSHGYIYRKSPDADRDTFFYERPNEVLAQVELETEIRRLQVEDFIAAVHSGGTSTVFGNPSKVRVVAPNGNAVMYNGGSLTPAAEPSNFIATQSIYKLANPPHILDWGGMFGVPDGSTLASMADVYVTSLAQLPQSMSSMALTYIKGNASFTSQRRLSGGGILVVDGNLRIETGSASMFAGVIYVTGDYYQSSPSSISGEVVVRGNVKVESPADIASLEYNAGISSEVRRQLGQYRERRTGLRTVL